MKKWKKKKKKKKKNEEEERNKINKSDPADCMGPSTCAGLPGLTAHLEEIC